jgi:uncharacterized integral membrane protein (TIGR00698 family)
MPSLIARHAAWPAIALAAALTLSPWGGAAVGLVLGIVIALTLGNPLSAYSGPVARHLLAVAIVCLGAGMDLWLALKVGVHGIGYTAAGILLAFALGLMLAQRLKVSQNLSLLIISGTAICGGSAIAAIAPVLRARDHEIALAIACVFLLNALALLCFPPIGHALGMSPEHFGLWAALAIHDTSSVVGAAASYPEPALEIATAAKLARALWIAPLALLLARVIAVHESTEVKPPRVSIPWFIPGFVAAAALVAWLPVLKPVGLQLAALGKHGLALALLLIGLNLKASTLRSLGYGPALLAVVLWVVLASATLLAIQIGWID